MLLPGFDRRNVFNFQYVYNLPQFKGSNKLVQLTAGGWEYSGVTQFWSGTLASNGDSPTNDACDLKSSGNLVMEALATFVPTISAVRS